VMKQLNRFIVIATFVASLVYAQHFRRLAGHPESGPTGTADHSTSHEGR
jgi:hypothetical protein